MKYMLLVASHGLSIKILILLVGLGMCLYNLAVTVFWYKNNTSEAVVHYKM